MEFLSDNADLLLNCNIDYEISGVAGFDFGAYRRE
jgi:hypothetical protein